MFKLLLWAAVIYLGYIWLRRIAGIQVSSKKNPEQPKKKNLYSKMDIQDAEFKDIDDEK